MTKPAIIRTLTLFSLLLFAACGEKETIIEVQSIAISQPSAEMQIGETMTLKATVSPSNASYDGLNWTSTNPKVASVSASGLVTAISEGNTTVSAMAGGKTASCAITVVRGIISVSSVSLNKTYLEMVEGDTETLVASVLPDDATDKTVTWTSSNEGVATVQDGTVTAIKEGEATVTAMSGGINATCRIIVEKNNVPDAVDLGLSVKWASYNLGASKPEDNGDYYAWGELCLQEDHGIGAYNLGTYEWGQFFDLSKYNTDSSIGRVDNRITLDLEDDVARSKWGRDWRMATYYEWEELLNPDNCSWFWGEENGVKGYKVISKKAGYTDKYIFLPASGSMCDNVLSSGGYYWSSSLYPNVSTQAYCIEFHNSENPQLSINRRCYGMTIRPVSADYSPTTVYLNETKLSLFEGQQTKLLATSVSDSTEPVFIWTSGDESVARVDQNGILTALSPGQTTIAVDTGDGGHPAKCLLTVKALPIPVAVDLGLSVNWATFNLGSSEPSDFGDYFPWGKTEPKYEYGYSQSQTPLWRNGNGQNTSNYSEPNPRLDLVDDAANVNWGESWRIPTDYEWNELMKDENCSWIWTTENGVNGYRITSKKDGFTSQSIFLPAAGYHSGTRRYSIGDNGYYWSSINSPHISGDACNLEFYAQSVSWEISTKGMEYAIRPVDGAQSRVTICLNEKELRLFEGQSSMLIATILPQSTIDKTVMWSSDNVDVAVVDQDGRINAMGSGTAIITAKTHLGGQESSCIVTVYTHKPVAIDLGLSVKWASFNLGATSSEEFGDYYAWGDIDPNYEYGYSFANSTIWGSPVWRPEQIKGYQGYNWTSYKWMKDFYFLNKYNTDGNYGIVDNKVVLELEDDAANCCWGENWRIPTDIEWEELLDPANCDWVESFENNVKGYRITSKIEGYKNQSIFIPAAGMFMEEGFDSFNLLGSYWSSSINPNAPRSARSLFFWHNYNKPEICDYTRSCGLSIRPVAE